MGNSLSVPSWCRIAEFMMGMLLEVEVVGLTYIDDTTIISDTQYQPESAQMFDSISEMLGLVRSLKEKSNRSTLTHKEMKILGLLFSKLNNQILIKVPESKLNYITSAAKDIILKLTNKFQKSQLKKQVSYKEAASLVGNANYIVCAQSDRAGS